MLNKNYYYSIILTVSTVALSLCALGVYYRTNITTFLDDYAIRATCEKLGSKPLNTEHVAFIKSIAAEMDIHEPIIIRKMNSQAMQTYGYCNAMAAFCIFSNLFPLPLSSQPFLFISDGFFEDLSSEEQRFLIGHELVHIKKQHCRFILLISFMLILILMALWLVTGLRLRYGHLLLMPLLFGGIVLVGMGNLAYRRHIEQEADHICLASLKSYDGCLKICERWKKEYGMSTHEPYYGLLADHPSLTERKTYCTLMQHNDKDLL